MERFKESEIIYGKADIDYQAGITNEAFEFAAEIRQKLGKKGYLLEVYLSCFFGGAVEVWTAVINRFPPDGYLNRLISCVMDGETDEHPFYETVKAYIDTHPLKYQERMTRHTLYSIGLYGDYFKYRTNEQRKFLSKKLGKVMDTVYFDCLQTEIDEVTGPGSMEKLNVLLCQAFLSVTPMSAFMQDMSTVLMYDLVYRDNETGRIMAGLWLDSLSG